MLNTDEERDEGEERQGLLETFKQDGIGAGLAQGLGMVIPQSAQSGGQSGFGDIFSDFVEFSTIGDVKDVASGLDTSNDLDPLERGMSLLPMLGFAGTTVGVATAVHGYRGRQARIQKQQRANAVAEAQLRQQQLTQDLQGDYAASTIGPEGARWRPADPLTNVEDIDVDGPERAQFGADLQQFAAEQVAREGSYAPMHAGSYQELVAIVNEQYRESSGAEQGRAQAGLMPALQTLGKKLVERSEEGTYSNQTEAGIPATIDEQQFVAAQWATTRWMQGAEQGILKWADTGEVTNLDNFLSALDGTHGVREQAQALDLLIETEVKLMNMSQGPDWTPTPGTRIETAYLDPETNSSRVFLAVDNGLLPDDVLIDEATLRPYDKAALNDRAARLNEDAIVADMAANLIITYQREAVQNPARLQDSLTWYRRQNDVVKYMADQTGHSVERVAAYYATLSQVTKWVPDNIVGATHMLLQHTRQDLVPGSAEYTSVFKEAMQVGGWGEVMLQYTSKADVELNGLNADTVLDFWANPENAKTQTGKYRGVESNVKQENLEMLNAGVPWQLFLRTSKYHNFAHGMIDPTTGDIATIDTHSNNATMGMIWTELLGSKGQRSIESILKKGDAWQAEGYGTDMVVDQAMIDEAVRVMREELNMPEDRIATIKKRFQMVPSKKAEARYRAQQKAHLIARDYLGLDAGHQVQAATWIPIQELKLQISAIRKKIRDNAGKGNDRIYGAIWDDTMRHHMEGNPRWQQGVIGLTRNATQDVQAPPPPGVLKNADDIHLEPLADGTTAVFARTTPRNRRVLRHLRPAGPTIDGMRQMVPRRAKSVTHTGKHLELAKTQVDNQGLPVTVQTRTMPGNSHIAEAPGNHVVFELQDQAAANELMAQLNALEQPFDIEVAQVGVDPGGFSRQRLSARQLSSFKGRLESPTQSPFVTNDWAAISAYTDTESVDAHRRLGEELRQKGYHPLETTSAYEGQSERAWVVFGMPYEEAHSIGNKYKQDSVMTREGLIYSDGQHQPVKDSIIFGADARQSPYYSEVKIGGRKVAFSLELDEGRAHTADGINALHGTSAKAAPRTQVQVHLGGVDAGVPSKFVDQVWQTGTGHSGVVSSSAYVHGGLWQPHGTMRATETVVTDGSSVSSMRTAADTDASAGNQFDVYVPEHEWRQLGKDSIEIGRGRRTMEQAMSLKREDLANGQIHIDGDVTLQYPVDAEVRAGANQGRILGLRINGEAPKTALVDLQGDVPTIILGEAGYQAGLVEVKLSNGRVTSMQAWSEGDLYKADEALGLAGVSVSQMRLKTAKVGPPDLTKTVDFTPSGSTFLESVGTGPAITWTGAEGKLRDGKFSDQLEEKIGTRVKFDLGNRIQPSQAQAIADTVEGLLTDGGKFGAFTDTYGVMPASILSEKVLGQGVVVSRFKKGQPIDLDGLTPEQAAAADAQNELNRKRADATSGLTTLKAPGTFSGIYLNETTVMRDQMHDGKYGELIDNLIEYSNASAREGVNIVEGTLVHEIGHRVEESISFRGLELEFEQRVNRAMNEIGSDLDIAENLSMYATENLHEFFAEAWTEVIYNPDAHPALKDLVKDIFEGAQLLDASSMDADIQAIIQVWTGAY